VEILQDNLKRKLILVIAPAGYGKTTLLADLTAHADRPVCWVRLTEHDRDPMRLAGVLVESLGTRFPRARKHLNLSGLESLPPEGVGRAMASGIAQAVSRSLLLVIDDLHLLSASQGSAAFLTGLVGAAPPNLCCILSGREVLDLPLAKPTAESNILTIGAGDLALEEDELEGLLASDDRSPVDVATRRRLMIGTKGWVAGVLLLQLRGLESLQASTLDGKELAYEYFAAEVLGKQSDELKDFVLRSSVLPVMTAEAVEKVLRIGDGGRWLKLAVRKGLFISATGSSPHTYEYHPLFREFLRSELSRKAKRQERVLRLRAAAYLARCGDEEQAVIEFLAAGAPTKALAVAEGGARRARIEGRLETLRRWESLLAGSGSESGWVLLRISYVLGERGQVRGARAAWQRGSRAARRLKNRKLMDLFKLQEANLRVLAGDTRGACRLARRLISRHSSGARDSGLLAEAYNLLAFALFTGDGDLREAGHLSHRALRIGRGQDAYLRVGHLLTHWAVTAWAGNKAESSKSASECMNLTRNMNPQHASMLMFNNLADDAALEGRFSEAIALAGRGLALSRSFGDSTSEAVILVTVGDLLSDIGRSKDALSLYDRSLRAFRVGEPNPWIRYAQYRRVVALRRMGEVVVASVALRKLLRSRDRRVWGREIEAEKMADLAIKRPRVALREIERLLAPPVRKFSAHRHVALEGHRARILAGTGMSGGAHAALDRALRLAKGYGLLIPLAGEIIASDQLKDLARSRFAQNPIWLEIEGYLSRAADLPGVGSFFSDAQPSEGHIAVLSLGRLSVISSGQEALFKPKATEVLLYLLEEGPVPLESIVEQFWGHLGSNSQGANLHATIYSLRKKLGKAAIEVSNGVVRVGESLPMKYDVRDFLDAVSAASRMLEGSPKDYLAALEAATSLYSGAFAPNLDSNWVRNRRRELEETFVDATLAYSRVALQVGEPEKAIVRLRRASSVDPYREDVAAVLLKCLWRAGRRAEAQHFSRSFADLVRRDLGLGPSEQVSRVLQEIEESALLSVAGPWDSPARDSDDSSRVEATVASD
jgi:DNA-binding SARP family transcriptional activator